MFDDKALKQLQTDKPVYQSGAEGWWGEVIRRTAIGAGADPTSMYRRYRFFPHHDSNTRSYEYMKPSTNHLVKSYQGSSKGFPAEKGIASSMIQSRAVSRAPSVSRSLN